MHGVSGAGAGVGGPCCLRPLLLSSPNLPDYKKTSLAPYVRVFEQFVEEMERARKGELLRRSGKRQAGGPQGEDPKGGHPRLRNCFFLCKTFPFSALQTCKENSEASQPGAAVAAPLLAPGPPWD